MFEKIAQSWKFAKLSYLFVFQHKKLMLFPVISTIATVIVFLSFILPLSQLFEQIQAGQSSIPELILLFIFYFVNYMVIVFFNTGLIACTLKILNGKEASVSYGLSFAMKRLPQIVGWVFISAIVGVILNIIENANEQVGEFISSLLGSAWTALSYFVLPVIVLRGVGPIKAFQRSTEILKQSWGTALIANFSLNLLGFVILLPIMILFAVLFFIAASNGTLVGMITVAAVATLTLIFYFVFTTTADSIIKVYLYTYAVDTNVLNESDAAVLENAFREKR